MTWRSRSTSRSSIANGASPKGLVGTSSRILANPWGRARIRCRPNWPERPPTRGVLRLGYVCAMGCLIVLVALFSSRFALVLMWLFTDRLGDAFDSTLGPLFGFFFLPWTTLM